MPWFFYLYPLLWVVIPALLFRSWLLWLRQKNQPSTRSFSFSWIGLVLASLSSLTAIGGFVFSAVVGPAYYDPVLMKIFFTGLLISLAALLAGLCGLQGKDSIRWHSVALGSSTVLFWFFSMSFE